MLFAMWQIGEHFRLIHFVKRLNRELKAGISHAMRRFANMFSAVAELKALLFGVNPAVAEWKMPILSVNPAVAEWKALLFGVNPAVSEWKQPILSVNAADWTCNVSIRCVNAEVSAKENADRLK